ncbi:MAG: CDP-glucose 4,6-dehydratase [Acidobacteriota bacterium]|nr:CDP-glucose 4,6-dehydratase [Acidobacteriota bacterium]
MSSFWNGKKVLVTGHTGFKGSWLSLWLQQAGAHVTGYALEPPTEPSLFEVAGVGEGMTSIEADIRDLDRLRSAVATHHPEVVVHLAAQSIVRAGYEDPVETYTTNVSGTLNLLEAIRLEPSARAVVVVTSDKCYDNLEIERGYVEEDALGGRDPYSSSKGCAELVTRAYRDSFLATADPPVAVASARAGNVVGGGDWGRDRLVPDVMRSCLEKQPLYIRNPEATRPWQHVLDPVGGYLALAERLWKDGAPFAEAWNFGPADKKPLPVRTLVEHILEHWDAPIQVELDPGPHPHEHHLLRLDTAKARMKLGWAARLSLPETLEWIADWYRAYRDRDDMKAVTEGQIARYRSLG